MSAEVSASVAIYGITADEIKVDRSEHPGLEGTVYLHIARRDVWLTLGRRGDDLQAEAAALRKLALLAEGLAAELEDRTRAGTP